MLSVLVASLIGATPPPPPPPPPPGFARVPTPAGASTFAAAVSADGTTVVGQLGLADGSVEAFRWRIGDDTIDVIGDLEGGLHFSSATAVSADGAVASSVGRCTTCARRRLVGAKTPWHLVRFAYLGGIKGKSFSSSSTPVMTSFRRPPGKARFMSYAKRPSSSSLKRDDATAPRAPYAQRRHNPRRSLAITRVAACNEKPSMNGDNGARRATRGDNGAYNPFDFLKAEKLHQSCGTADAFALTVFEIYKDLHELKRAACDVDFRCRCRRLL